MCVSESGRIIKIKRRVEERTSERGWGEGGEKRSMKISQKNIKACEISLNG